MTSPDMHQARVDWLVRLEEKAIQYRNAQRRGDPRAERGLNLALEGWTRIHDRVVLAAYEPEEACRG